MGAPSLVAPTLSISGTTLQWTSSGSNTQKYMLYCTKGGTTTVVDDIPPSQLTYSLPSSISGTNVYKVKAVGSYKSLLTYKQDGTDYVRTGNLDGKYDYWIQNGSANSYITAEKITSDVVYKYAQYITNNVAHYVEVGVDSNNKLYTATLPVSQLTDTIDFTIATNTLEIESNTLTVVQLTPPTISVSGDTISWTVSSGCNYRVFINGSEQTVQSTGSYSIANIDDITIPSGSYDCYNIYVITTRTSGNNTYYLDSANSNIVKKLKAPVLSISGSRLIWEDPFDTYGTAYAVYADNVLKTTIYYDDTNPNKYYELSALSIGTHSMKVQASYSGYQTSHLSTPLSATILAAPSVSYSGSTISWTAISGAERYLVYVDDSYFETITTTSYDTSSVQESVSGTYVKINIVAAADGKVNSTMSSDVNKLKAPYVSGYHGSDHIIEISSLSGSISGAQCKIYVNDSLETTISYPSTNYDLDNLELATGTYGITVAVSCSGYMDSKKSNTFVYDTVNVPSFDQSSWAEIKSMSSDAAAYWNVGDVKWITLNGTVRGTTYNNLLVGVYILDFNTADAHGSGAPHTNHDGPGMTIGGFVYNNSGTNANMVLIDSYYLSYDSSIGFSYDNSTASSDDCMWFEQNSYIRTAVLGAQSNSTPATNSLMAALPSDMRAVLSVMTTIGEDIGGTTHTSYDYIKLMSARELTGSAIPGINCDNYISDTQYLLFNSLAPSSALNAKRRYYCLSANSGPPDYIDTVDYGYYWDPWQMGNRDSIRWWVRESAYYAYATPNPDSGAGAEASYAFSTDWSSSAGPDFKNVSAGLAPVFYIEPDPVT